MSKYIAIPISGGPGNFQNWANPSGKPGKRNSFPANNNSAPQKAPAKAPSPGNHQKAAQHFGRKIAGKRLARQMLNIHPAGRIANIALDLLQIGDEMGYVIPGQKGQKAGFPGFKPQGECGSRSAELAWHGYNGDAARANSCFALNYDLTNKQIGGLDKAVNGDVSWITTFGNIGTDFWGYRIGKIHSVWSRPAGKYDPVYWQPAVPDKAPQFLPWSQPKPNRTPNYGRPAPQSRPGISTNTNVRPNNLGVIELRATNNRPSLRINSENRPNRPGQKETKARSKSWSAFRALHKIAAAATEAVDFLEVLAISTGYDGPGGEAETMEMINHISNNLEKFDPELFMVEFIKNEIEDQVIGRLSGLVDKSGKKLNLTTNVEAGLAL